MMAGSMSDVPPGLRVFISSTYLDNKERRKLVLDAVLRAGMTPVGMEWFEASARPTVDECLRKVRECQVFVGILAHRYGWEPDGHDRSITQMEYEAARAAGLPRLMFLIDPAVPFTHADLDPPPSTWDKQKKLAQFKELCAKDQLPAVFQENTLHGAVLDALQKWRERAGTVPAAAPLPAPRSPPDELQSYRQAMFLEHGKLDLAGFKTRVRVPIDLEELCVSLLGVADLRGTRGEPIGDEKHSREVLRETEAKEIDLLESFRLAEKLKGKRSRGVVILGEPGSGKTTFLKRLLIRGLKEGGPLQLGLPADMLPVFLPLRALKNPTPDLPQLIDDTLALGDHGLPPGLGQRLTKLPRLLLLFDGLDEVADLAQRREVAGWIEKKVMQRHPEWRAAVTCRFAGYGPSRVELGEEFLELHVRPLSERQREQFVRTWYRLVEEGLEPDSDRARRKAVQQAEALNATLSSGDFRSARVAEMVGNPLLLANLCLVHRDRGGALPKGRKRLYDECIDVLLELWRGSKKVAINVTAEQGKRVLQPVAAWMHEKDGRTRATAKELAAVLEEPLKVVRWRGGNGDARQFLATVRDESGLLTGWGPDEFGFMHLGFQEYLAAMELRRQATEGGEAEKEKVYRMLADHYGESWWQEVLLLMVAMGNPSIFKPLMREVVKRPAFAEHPALLRMLLEEAAEVSPDPFQDLLDHPDQGAELARRQQLASEALRLLGIGKAKAPKGMEVTEKGGVEMVPIPRGEFFMGSPDTEVGRWDEEGPQHKVTISSDFWMGRYPVTNEQYGLFLKENPQVSPPQYWGDRSFNQAQQPVVGVTWKEAAAFAKWAGGRLPTEAEWEYACRARTTGPRYDDDLDAIAWWSGNSGGSTHPVGQKKPNAWGLYDMLGNVWEWCSDGMRAYAAVPITDPVGPVGSARVVRGGSWGNVARDVRAAIRSGNDPADWYGNLGFRLVRGQSARQDKPAGAEPQGRRSRPREGGGAA
jgi:formylglycine-generating enzyme required for sulfatase activity